MEVSIKNKKNNFYHNYLNLRLSYNVKYINYLKTQVKTPFQYHYQQVILPQYTNMQIVKNGCLKTNWIVVKIAMILQIKNLINFIWNHLENIP